MSVLLLPPAKPRAWYKVTYTANGFWWCATVQATDEHDAWAQTLRIVQGIIDDWGEEIFPPRMPGERVEAMVVCERVELVRRPRIAWARAARDSRSPTRHHARAQA